MVIKGAMVCDANGEQRGDIRIKEGKIIKVERSILPQANEEVLEVQGLVLMPSAIDLNVRVQDSIFTKENLLKLSAKASAGGIGLAVLMPDCKPLLNTETGIELLNALKSDFKANIVGVVGSRGEELQQGKYTLAPLSILHKKGAVGIYSQSSEDGNLLRRACEFASMLNIPMFFNCEDSSLSANGVMNDGKLSARLGLPSIPALSETKEVAMVSEIVCFMQVRAIFNTIATNRSIEILQEAKKRNSSIFIQTSIHHLLLTEDLCNNYNTAAKIKPPLKSESTRIKLIKAVKNLEIDLITALQSEKSLAQKDLAFEEAAFGVDMIEYFLPMCYSLFVKSEGMTLKEMSKILSLNPARALGMDSHKGLIKEGYDADLLLFDTKQTQIIDNPNSPFCDWIFNGKVKQLFVNGKAV
ncbi:amidohydrolase family protein [Helicobacter apodemus]|uniref:Dihydroorotase n=1 Tax=Helicobacter apodemus TaxID=135569 RepID=A0A2U8FB74_9HELI|nr:amidohydrolase family protein [Helicobacter apodemus]AWI33492.1 dihydroorotase [Helicobacter apodemus]